MGQGGDRTVTALDEDLEALAEAQAARGPVALARAKAAVASLSGRGRDAGAAELLRGAQKAARRGKRIRLILEAGSAWVAPLAPLAACREGCAACCHLPVAITSAEAQLLSQASGRPVETPVGGQSVAELMEDPTAAAALASGPRSGPVGPCPFLAGERCGVYADRPLACRLHMNLDADALLCQVVPGRPAQVPYADTRRMLAYALALQADEVLADIRDFFPARAAADAGPSSSG
jgi:Fe-S-cluster containining protein